MLEPQYLYALFLAACCSRLDEPCRHFQFYRDSDGASGSPLPTAPSVPGSAQAITVSRDARLSSPLSVCAPHFSRARFLVAND
jgi:hypothetical protein